MPYNAENKFGPPIPVLRALRKLGQDLADARKRRRIPIRVMAERAGISQRTLQKIENGDGGVAIASYVSVLFTLGMVSRLEELADSRNDIVGLSLEDERLPKRIRLPKPQMGTPNS